jgi:hypothetical protein
MAAKAGVNGGEIQLAKISIMWRGQLSAKSAGIIARHHQRIGESWRYRNGINGGMLYQINQRIEMKWHSSASNGEENGSGEKI